jgi:hypothetical protein
MDVLEIEAFFSALQYPRPRAILAHMQGHAKCICFAIPDVQHQWLIPSLARLIVFNNMRCERLPAIDRETIKENVLRVASFGGLTGRQDTENEQKNSCSQKTSHRRPFSVFLI